MARSPAARSAARTVLPYRLHCPRPPARPLPRRPPGTYNLLFAAVAETLAQVARRRLGAQIGFTAILHTWTQLLLFHPHLHCIVPGGGLDPGHTRWIATRPAFFLPVRVLAQVFRGKLLAKLQQALDRGAISRGLDRDPHDLLKRAAAQSWVVYAKPPFAGPESVLRYLGRYTHRVAISNRRIVRARGGTVAFRYRDRADGGREKTLELPVFEFLRRFLLHVLPRSFVRIRHAGLLANRTRREQISRCRTLLEAEPPPPPPTDATVCEKVLRLTGRDLRVCPACGEGPMAVVAELDPTGLDPLAPGIDSS